MGLSGDVIWGLIYRSLHVEWCKVFNLKMLLCHFENYISGDFDSADKHSALQNRPLKTSHFVFTSHFLTLQDNNYSILVLRDFGLIPFSI